jgi:flagellar motor switch protein FliM
VGDILPIDMPKTITAKIEGIPIFNATFGEHKNKTALKVTDMVEQPKDTTPQYQLQKGKK